MRAKLKRGEFIMYKKVISVGMSFLMLFEFSTVNVFAKGGDEDFNSAENRNTKNPKYVDYCKDSPVNKYGNPVDVDCAVESSFPKFKTNEKRPSLSLPKLGKTGEIDVHMWKYNGLAGLASDFEKSLKNANKRSIKGQFVANFIQETNKLFNLNSEIDAVGIVNNWLKKSNYSKSLYITKEDLLKWANKMQKYEKNVSADMGETLLGGGIGAAIGGAGGAGIGGLGGVLAGAGAAAGGGTAAGIGTAVAAEAAPLLAGAVGAGAAGGGAAAGAGVAAGAAAGAGAIALAPLVAFAALTGAVVLGVGGAYYGYHSSKERKLNKKALEELKKSAKQERKWDIYSSALENILAAINNKEWVDNDLLRAELSYEKDLPYARTNFINVGIGTPKNVITIFENLSTTLSNLKENHINRKNNKEEL